MANDDAQVGTILTRRDILRLTAGAGAGLALAALSPWDTQAAVQEKARRSVKLVASPALTEGPFFVDEKLKRADLLAGSNRPSVAGGVPLALQITLYRLKNGKFAPLSGATVDVWHADTLGVYSDEAVPMNHENTAGQKWLRGYQVSDADGVVRFHTIYPGWYESRTTHIHFKVRQKDGAKTREFTSQFFFDDAFSDRIFARPPYRRRSDEQVRNGDDNVFQERQKDGTAAGDHLTLVPAPSGAGYTTKIAIALTDDNLRVGGRRFGGPGGPPPDGFGGPGGPPPDGFGGPGGPPPPDFPW